MLELHAPMTVHDRSESVDLERSVGRRFSRCWCSFRKVFGRVWLGRMRKLLQFCMQHGADSLPGFGWRAGGLLAPAELGLRGTGPFDGTADLSLAGRMERAQSEHTIRELLVNHGVLLDQVEERFKHQDYFRFGRCLRKRLMVEPSAFLTGRKLRPRRGAGGWAAVAHRAGLRTGLAAAWGVAGVSCGRMCFSTCPKLSC